MQRFPIFQCVCVEQYCLVSLCMQGSWRTCQRISSIPPRRSNSLGLLGPWGPCELDACVTSPHALANINAPQFRGNWDSYPTLSHFMHAVQGPAVRSLPRNHRASQECLLAHLLLAQHDVAHTWGESNFI